MIIGYRYKVPRLYGDRIFYGVTLPEGAIVLQVFKS